MKDQVKTQLGLWACEQREHFQQSMYTQGPQEQILEQTLHTGSGINRTEPCTIL